MTGFAAPILDRFGEYLRENPAWGSLHIVLDDDNTQDSNVVWCIEWALEHDDAEGAALGWIVLGMSERRRLQLGKAAAMHIGWRR